MTEFTSLAGVFRRNLRILTGSLALLLTAMIHSETAPMSLQQVLNEKTEPAGVVIEIVTGSPGALEWALPMVKDYTQQLHQRFPEMPVAVVTHGKEQFALTKDNKDSHQKVHSLTQALVADGVNLHVCGTHAGWKGLTDEDFPEYVNVAAAGPAQINDYKSVGYLHIVIKGKDKKQ